MNVKSSEKGHDIIVIGTSMGGIDALSKLLSGLPADLSASLYVVIHLHPNSPSALNRMLAEKTALRVKFAEDGETPHPGTVYLAPPDQHLLLNEQRMILSRGPRENRSRPSIDPLFRSAAAAYTTRVIGLVLTGLLDDGSAGLQTIKDYGGIAVVQDPEDAAFPEMPQNALDAVKVDHCVSLAKMGALLKELILRPAGPPLKASKRLKNEIRLSQGLVDTKLEENIMGKPAPFICPDCGGSLSELTEGNLIRYRCHEGHAYTALSFLDAQWERVEFSLWSAVRVMDEQIAMLRKLAKKQVASANGSVYHERANELSLHAERLREYLLYHMKEDE